MRVPRAVGRFVGDWHNVATLIAAVLVAVIAYVVLEGAAERQRAFDAAEAASRANIDIADRATRRIDRLTQQIAELQKAADDARQTQAAAEARSSTQIGALVAQVQQLGGRPVVTVPNMLPSLVPTATPATIAPRSTTTTTRKTTTRPRSTTSTRR